MTELLDYTGAGLLLVGSLFSLAAAVGLVRFPGPLTRMHAATKPLVFGLILVLTGVALTLRDPKVIGFMALAVGFQVMTAPVSGHLVARRAHRDSLWDEEQMVIDQLGEDQDAGADSQG